MIKSSKYTKSAGLILTKGRKVLLVNPIDTESNFSFPKGEINDQESCIEAAIRETFEEVGIFISKTEVEETPIIVNYVHDTMLYKTVYLFKVKRQITEVPDILPSSMLQTTEINKAYFMEFKEAIIKSNWRYRKIILNLFESMS